MHWLLPETDGAACLGHAPQFAEKPLKHSTCPALLAVDSGLAIDQFYQAMPNAAL